MIERNQVLNSNNYDLFGIDGKFFDRPFAFYGRIPLQSWKFLAL